jgi:hypothetical protein
MSEVTHDRGIQAACGSLRSPPGAAAAGRNNATDARPDHRGADRRGTRLRHVRG